MDLKKSDTALVVIEPQNDVLSEKGGSWPLVGDSVKENNTVEKMMLDGKEFWRPSPLSLAGFPGSGADWLDRYKPYIEDGKTVVVSPHKVWGPQTMVSVAI